MCEVPCSVLDTDPTIVEVETRRLSKTRIRREEKRENRNIAGGEIGEEIVDKETKLRSFYLVSVCIVFRKLH
jgi:hypothetical protein